MIRESGDISIYDNTNDLDIKTVIANIREIVRAIDMTAVLDDSVIKKYKDYVPGKIVDCDCFGYYNCVEKKFYRCFSYHAVDQDGYSFADAFMDTLY